MEWRIISAVLCLIGHAASQTAQTKEYNITFSLTDDFKTAYSNISQPETQSLISNITAGLDPVFKKLTGYQNMTIHKFSNGSIVTDAALQFNASVNGPNATEVQQVLLDAIASGNLTLKIRNDSINVTAPVTAPTNTTTPATATTSFNLKFSILDTFNASLSNISSPESIALTNVVTTGFTTVLTKKFANFFKMLIRKFSNGSVVTDSDLQFFNNGTTPTVKDVAKAIVDAATNGNFTFKVDPQSIKVTDSSGNTSSSSPAVLCSMLTALWMTLASLLLTGVMHF